jgi:hypothetical protein
MMFTGINRSRRVLTKRYRTDYINIVCMNEPGVLGAHRVIVATRTLQYEESVDRDGIVDQFRAADDALPKHERIHFVLGECALENPYISRGWWQIRRDLGFLNRPFRISLATHMPFYMSARGMELNLGQADIIYRHIGATDGIHELATLAQFSERTGSRITVSSPVPEIRERAGGYGFVVEDL